MSPQDRWKMVEALARLKCFEARGATTFCNEFLQAASFLWGCLDLSGKLIRDIHLCVKGLPTRWKPAGMAEAQLAANQGRLVIALWSDEAPQGDHGCIIAPGKLESSGTWGMEVPQAANVGKDNFFGKKLSFAFPANQRPEFYIWTLA